jgi:cell volume regulation protein A
VLFDGGMHIGRRRLRSSAGAVLWIGVVGTVVTAAAVAPIAHALGFGWRTALIIGTALAPTDPAVVFSVLGRREIRGRTGILLEGESGVNDPVGIALMISLLASGADGGIDARAIGVGFALQLAVGGVVGLAGGRLLVLVMQRVQLPNEGLYALRTLAAALAIYGVATVAHGSGFLAVFVAGILLGDERAPYKADIRRFSASLAGIAEVVVFVVLGLTVSLRTTLSGHAWPIGLILAAALTLVVRPLLVGLVLWPVTLRPGERIFVLWAGLKGAVPILLGTFVVAAGTPDATLIYDVIFVVVAFSVLVQGGLVPVVAARCGVPMRTVEPAPWSLGVRFREPPDGVRRLRVAEGSAADGCAVEDLDLGEDVWISLVIRHGRPLHVRPSSVLAAGDEVLLLADPEESADPGPLFAAPEPPRRTGRPGGDAAGPPAT